MVQSEERKKVAEVIEIQLVMAAEVALTRRKAEATSMAYFGSVL